jgi:hypothetical protein
MVGDARQISGKRLWKRKTACKISAVLHRRLMMRSDPSLGLPVLPSYVILKRVFQRQERSNVTNTNTALTCQL